MDWLAQAIFWVAVTLTASASSYLLLLALAAMWPSRKLETTQAKQLAFAIVVPAHNEEILLPKLLESLLSQDYPRDLYSVNVIADNCSDGTAAIARSHDVWVFERHDPSSQGKGQALRWFFNYHVAANAGAEAFAFVDADSEVDEHFLARMNEALNTGANVLQASYRVLAPTSHALVGLRAIAFALFHDVRGRGHERLGLSCGLWGNGMVLTRDVVARIPWGSFSAVEDAEQHIQLVLSGERVEFVPETYVAGYMPGTFGAAKDQQVRWEGGKQSLLKTYGPRLLAQALLTRSRLQFAALVDLSLPPTSVHLLLSIALAGLGVWFGGPASWVATAGLVAFVTYVLVGLCIARLPARVYLSLFYAPVYIGWKAWLFACQLPKRAGPSWLPTSRSS